MTNYQKILRLIVAFISYLGGISLLIGLVFYLTDVKLNDAIGLFFQAKTIPFVAILMVILFIIGSVELYFVKIKKR